MRREEIDSVLEQMAAAGWGAGKFMGLETVAGGIHDAHRMRFERADVFLKTTRLESAARLASEAFSLARLRESATLLLPEPLLHGLAGEMSWLAIRWLDLFPASPDAQRRLGALLADMHRCEADRYGWPQNNHIGTNSQLNGWSDDWGAFFVQQRLEPQLRLAERQARGEWLQRGFRLLERVPQLLGSHRPEASLLHGDLWSGNIAMRRDGEPVVYDPAAWFGDRETDIAMTELFGGFTPDFYSAYNDAWPLDAGYEQRRPLYQLYHVLNHVNMFGGGYERQAARMIDELLAD